MSFFGKSQAITLYAGLLAMSCGIDVQAQTTVDIGSSPDYRYRDVFGVSGGPVFDPDQLLEVFLNDSGFDTRSGLEFPLDQANSCRAILSATLTLETINAVVDGTVDVYGFEGSGTPALENVTLLGPLQTSFVPVTSGSSIINLPTGFIQSTLTSGASHIGFALATAVVDNGFTFQDSETGPAPLLSLECADLAPVPVLSGWLSIIVTFLGIVGIGMYYQGRLIQ